MDSVLDKKRKSEFYKKKKYEKIMLISAFSVLLTATILSIINDNDIPTVIPFHTTIVPIINGASAFLCLILLFIKENYRLQCLILFIQGICTALTGYEVLGAFLYSAMFLLLFVNNFFTTNAKKKVSILVLIWILTVLSLLPFGFQRFLLEFVISFFFAGFYAYVYKKLEHILSIFIPVKNDSQIIDKLPERGSKINLEEFGLSERQIKFVKDYLKNKSSYKELSEKYFISTSTVKKDMNDVFTKFNVKNINELYLLLIQFEVE